MSWTRQEKTVKCPHLQRVNLQARGGRGGGLDATKCPVTTM